MRIIDRRWKGLAEGYRALLDYQRKLETEYTRAIQAGYRQKYRQALTGWQKKRRVLIAMASLSVLGVIALCVSGVYLRDYVCILAYWTLVVIVILVTTIVARRAYVTEMLAGRPEEGAVNPDQFALARRWWQRLEPADLVRVDPKGKKGESFLVHLARHLPDDYITVAQPATTLAVGAATGALGTPNRMGGGPFEDILLLGPTGIWLFSLVPWRGRVVKRDGTWYHPQPRPGKPEGKRLAEAPAAQAPDEHWLARKAALVEVFRVAFPDLPWLADSVQGGLVFDHPDVVLEKEKINGFAAPYGQPRGWIARIQAARPVDGLNMELRLALLEAFAGLAHETSDPPEDSSPARGEAEGAYAEAAGELRQLVAGLLEEE
ncbi:MAG: hypothetical protein ABIJ39_03040 [Chloroflexota bacterium]